MEAAGLAEEVDGHKVGLQRAAAVAVALILSLRLMDEFGLLVVAAQEPAELVVQAAAVLDRERREAVAQQLAAVALLQVAVE